nr:WXG100 family type VII secretion target [uncultured Actinoplanes sp.]
MTGPIVSDEASAKVLINAFHTADADQRQTQSQLDTLHSMLASIWTGDAATGFGSHIDELAAGLKQARTALDSLNGKVNALVQLQTRTESDNSSLVTRLSGGGNGRWAS